MGELWWSKLRNVSFYHYESRRLSQLCDKPTSDSMWLTSISGIYGAGNYSMNPLDGLLQTAIQWKLSKKTCIYGWQTNHCNQ